MAWILAGFAVSLALVAVLALLHIKPETNPVVFIVFCLGIASLSLFGSALGGYPTGESIGVLPPNGLYAAKIVLVGAEEGTFANQVFLMVWLPPSGAGLFRDPSPVKVYRIDKDRFVEAERVTSSDELVEAVVFYSTEHGQKMVRIIAL